MTAANKSVSWEKWSTKKIQSYLGNVCPAVTFSTTIQKEISSHIVPSKTPGKTRCEEKVGDGWSGSILYWLSGVIPE
jgi:hypothetical protein